MTNLYNVKNSNERIKMALRSNLNQLYNFDNYISITNIDFNLDIKNFFESLTKDYLYINNNIIKWCDYDNINTFVELLNLFKYNYYELDNLNNNIQIIGNDNLLTYNNKYLCMDINEFKNFTMNMDTYKGNIVRLYFYNLRLVTEEYSAYVIEFNNRQKKLKKNKY